MSDERSEFDDEFDEFDGEFDEFDPDDPWVIEDGDDVLVVEAPFGPAEALRAALADPSFLEELVATAASVSFVDADNRPLTPDQVRVAIVASAEVLRAALAGVALDEHQLGEATMVLASLAAMGADGADVRVDALDRLAADCRQMLLARFRPRRDGTFRLKWRAADRAVVADALAELRVALASDDDATTRLFPSPYGDDAERNAAWGLLARGELMDKRLASLDRVDQMMHRSSCTADELADLMRCINDGRLMIGTRLDVTETGPPPDMSPSDAATYAAYEHLGLLLEHAVLALRTTLRNP